MSGDENKKICGNCKYWVPEESSDPSSAPANSKIAIVAVSPTMRGFGQCSMVGSDCWTAAAFLTKPTFGCNQFEAKETKE